MGRVPFNTLTWTSEEWGGNASLLVRSRLAAISHIVTKLYHAIVVGLDLREMERDVRAEILEK